MRRNFLTDLNIVGATLAFREGNLIKYCLNDLTKICNYVVVVLDNYNKKTERIVMKYKKKYGERFIVGYSGLPVGPGILKKRFKGLQPKIRQSVLEEVKKLHQRKKIDILIWLDADECFTDYFLQHLKWFWESQWQILAVRPIMVFDSLRMVRGTTTIPNGRVFKYRPDMSAQGYSRGFYKPFTRSEIGRAYYITVHLAYASKRQRDYRAKYLGDKRMHECPYSRLWILEKDVRRYSPEKIKEIFKKIKHNFTVAEYLKKNEELST